MLKSWVKGAVAQLGERLVCNQEATGSIPVSSTKSFFTAIGGAVGLALWLFVFKGDLSRPGILFLWPMGLGSVTALVGMILERSAKSA